MQVCTQAVVCHCIRHLVVERQKYVDVSNCTVGNWCKSVKPISTETEICRCVKLYRRQLVQECQTYFYTDRNMSMCQIVPWAAGVRVSNLFLQRQKYVDVFNLAWAPGVRVSNLFLQRQKYVDVSNCTIGSWCNSVKPVSTETVII